MMLQYWHWIIFALALFAFEVIIPGAFFLWIGITALVLSGFAYLYPFTSATVQLILFGFLALFITYAGRKVVRNISKEEKPALLNRRAKQLVGQVITIDEPIVNGRAHITVGDTKWRVSGPDLPNGTVVKVTHVEGNILIVNAKK